ncbi:hypothetical protein ScalyP_jg9651 [Parmales sp. scaly parma]|nr:hypothetical protein ScalyP_jg9651 [Parmales sp. scaly parma]
MLLLNRITRSSTFSGFYNLQFCSTSANLPPPTELPTSSLTFSFSRSSGAGGQNVNKVNTKSTITFPLTGPATQLWLPDTVVQRMIKTYPSKVSKQLIFTQQTEIHRTQAKNKAEGLKILLQAVRDVWEEPKERNMRVGIGSVTKERRKNDKRQRSSVKENRGSFKF